MKKQLLASTMLVAAGALTASGAAEAKIDVTVNGYFEAVIGTSFADNENVFQLGDPTATGTLERPAVGANGVIGNRSYVDEHNEMEIHFNARTELDNGIKIRGHVELEGNIPDQGNDVIDEQYMIIRGNFGQLTLGSEDNAGHLMTIGYLGSWATGVGQNMTFDTKDFITPPFFLHFDGTLNDPRLRSTDNDSDKITYYTPRFAGFQLGASYIPNIEQDMNGSQATTDAVYNDGFAFGVNFQRKFDQFGIGTGFGYLHMNGPGANTINKDGRAWVASLRLDFGPFRIAGGFKKNINIFDSRGNSVGTNLSGEIFDIGGRLSFGPNRFSIGYSQGRMAGDVNTVSEREVDQFMASYARTLGPGVKWTANVIYGRFEGDANPGVVAAVTPDGQESEGFGLSTSIRLNF